MNETYEVVLVRFENLIKKLIKSYGLCHDFDEMQQVGRIALWEAYNRFDRAKGHFPAYAQKYVSGRMLQAAKRSARDHNRSFSDTRIETIHTYEVPYLDHILLEELVKGLSGRERLFVERVILKGEPQTELAKREGVSYETVRSWRKSALRKLRIKAEHMNYPKA